MGGKRKPGHLGVFGEQVPLNGAGHGNQHGPYWHTAEGDQEAFQKECPKVGIGAAAIHRQK